MLLTLREVDVFKRKFLTAELALLYYVAADPVALKISSAQGLADPFSEIYIGKTRRVSVYREYAPYIPVSAGFAELGIGPYPAAVA